MGMSLSVADWMTLVQLIYRMNCIEDSADYPRQVLELLRLMVDYSAAVFCRVEQQGYSLAVKGFEAAGVPDEDRVGLQSQLSSCAFLNGLCIDSSGPVTRGPVLSHFGAPDAGSARHIPESLQHALSMVLYHKESLLGYVVLWREPERPEFGTRDVCVLSTIRSHIALQLHKLTRQGEGADGRQRLGQALLRYQLSKREVEVLYHLVQGQSDSQVCEALFISASTFKKHLNHIYEKLQVGSRVQLLKRIEAETGGTNNS